MHFYIDAACHCTIGKVRKNNEDNYFFDNQCLETDNNGLEYPRVLKRKLRHELFLAVFDGMGGENFGEVASFAAADCVNNTSRKIIDYFTSKREFLNELCRKMNKAVIAKQQELCTNRMGTTMVALCFSCGSVYICNLGDSRAYRLRDGELLQLSVDHIEKREESSQKKAPLTQHLGIDPEEFLIEPYIVKDKLRQGDQYLLCSDGLTDMLTDSEINTILNNYGSTEECVKKLVDTALEKGGKDNITVIVCRIV